MSLVAVKNKFQVVIPLKVRQEIGLGVGDLLEAKVERGKIIFTPKSTLDRGIAEIVADFRAGRRSGPSKTLAELVASLDAKAAKIRAKKRTKKKPRK
jgi:AbrB family looped-hinge helix DNA binding protein